MLENIPILLVYILLLKITNFKRYVMFWRPCTEAFPKSLNPFSNLILKVSTSQLFAVHSLLIFPMYVDVGTVKTVFCFQNCSYLSLYKYSRGPSIKYVSTFLVIFDPSLPHVSNRHHFNTPSLKSTSAFAKF